MTSNKVKIGIGIVAILLLSGVVFLVISVWTFVPNITKVSELPGFHYFTNLSNVGMGTPEAALETFHAAIRNQGMDPIDPARMKEIWNLPDDFDDPNVSYAVDIGQRPGHWLSGGQPGADRPESGSGSFRLRATKRQFISARESSY